MNEVTKIVFETQPNSTIPRVILTDASDNNHRLICYEDPFSNDETDNTVYIPEYLSDTGTWKAYHTPENTVITERVLEWALCDSRLFEDEEE